MLLQFTVENYRSVREPVELSMRASDEVKARGHGDHLTSLRISDQLRVLRCAAVYGANASGKSNLISALASMRAMVLSGDVRGHHRPFRLDAISHERPSEYEAYILVEGKIYGYRFSSTQARVVEEELVVLEHEHEKLLFSRIGSDFTFSDTIRSNAKDPRFVDFLGEATPSHQLFLTDAQHRNLKFEPIDHVLEWFTNHLKIIQPESRFAPLVETIDSDEEFRRFLSNALAQADTGIGGLLTSRRVIASQEGSDFDSLPKESQLQHILGALQVIHPRRQAVREHADGAMELITLLARHDPQGIPPVTFGFEDESDGTRRYLDLIPMIYFASKGPTVFVVDELDRSLHTLLARDLIERFLSSSPPSQSQLIFTTHDTNLLDCEVLRPDCIWFTEKDQGSATSLYSLAEFQPHQLAELEGAMERGYLMGRFGGIPFLSDPVNLHWPRKPQTETEPET